MQCELLHKLRRKATQKVKRLTPVFLDRTHSKSDQQYKQAQKVIDSDTSTYVKNEHWGETKIFHENAQRTTKQKSLLELNQVEQSMPM